ncbi:response regulator transcription factor [Clostridium niameyense]|uniref:Stage 0 sporulation protein A homolog n=1 Tax=Clostridium niameyense TaxID=1622073 RepID=A0A6M0RBG3_9CLOT|nr:response regulator transcription factor [Clostridium niameyense]NEZ47127.1 response regulator transcription factor [Clostridium niameyense]
MDKNINILVVEDDNDINTMLTKLMKKNNYNVVQAYSGTEAMLHIKNNEFHLILLDLMLPGITGEELIQNIRKTEEMPIIIISAKVDKNDKINLLKLGADDYITKPFDIEELFARVYSNIRRYIKFNSNKQLKNNLIYKDINLNKDTKEVHVNNKKIIVTVKEFLILELLLSYPKKIFSKENLFESVWREEYFGDDNTVNVHMSNLRNKLHKANPNEEYIETIWGMGYKLKE